MAGSRGWQGISQEIADPDAFTTTGIAYLAYIRGFGGLASSNLARDDDPENPTTPFVAQLWFQALRFMLTGTAETTVACLQAGSTTSFTFRRNHGVAR
jgi:hypothetical protein